MEWLLDHALLVGFLLIVLDKIVTITPCKWDDLIFTAVKAAWGQTKKTGKKLRGK